MTMASWLGLTGAPLDGSCDMSQFWQNTHLNVHELKNIVPEPPCPTRGGSSPKCRNQVLTRLVLSSLHAPFLVAAKRSTLHLHSQNVQQRSIRPRRFAFRSRKLVRGIDRSERSRLPESTSFNNTRALSERCSCSFHSASSDGSSRSMLHAKRLAIRYFAGRRFLETISYHESLLCISS